MCLISCVSLVEPWSPDIWLNIILDVSVGLSGWGLHLNGLTLGKAHCPPYGCSCPISCEGLQGTERLTSSELEGIVPVMSLWTWTATFLCSSPACWATLLILDWPTSKTAWANSLKSVSHSLSFSPLLSLFFLLPVPPSSFFFPLPVPPFSSFSSSSPPL